MHSRCHRSRLKQKKTPPRIFRAEVRNLTERGRKRAASLNQVSVLGVPYPNPRVPSLVEQPAYGPALPMNHYRRPRQSDCASVQANRAACSTRRARLEPFYAYTLPHVAVMRRCQSSIQMAEAKETALQCADLTAPPCSTRRARSEPHLCMPSPMK